MKRRTFIKRSTAATIPLALGGLKVSALSNNALLNSMNVDDDKVLVIIQLNGGNDGLNMLIPKDQFANLATVRPDIIIPENTILDLTDTAGFHPAMADLKNVFDDGKLELIQSVGYPNQNRSHFRSTDIWNTGSSAEEVLTTGWLGRYFNTFAPNYPVDYPNDEFPDPIAITIGSTVNETCEGLGGNYSMALVDPENLSALPTPTNNNSPDSCYGDKMDFLVTSIIQTNDYNEVIEAAYGAGSNLSDKYNNTLAEKLKLVARLISGGLKTKVYIVNLGGFDTHANQVETGDTTTGEHAVLLEELSSAICAFQHDLELLGLEERVLGMTYSEFGRRIRANNSLGTDHGTAAPMILFGPCVVSGILGENPEISSNVSQDEGVPMQFDFRSVYGSILMSWFGVEQEVVQDLLFEDFQFLPIVHSTCSVPNRNIIKDDSIKLEAFPNPFNNQFTVEFTVIGGAVKISLFDTIGNQLKVLTNQRFLEGKHTISMEGSDLIAGIYYLHIQTEYGSKVKRLVKI